MQPAKAQVVKNDAKKKGNWDCQCGFNNFGFRAVCLKCGSPMTVISPGGEKRKRPQLWKWTAAKRKEFA